MLELYKYITSKSEKILLWLLNWRENKGKEDIARINERKGICTKPRPDGKLLWVHAASVGEAQSTLILIEKILKQTKDLNIIVTSGTVTSAKLMEDRLPQGAFHQYAPLDHPKWIKKFIEHWKPNAVFLIESELWPNMLAEIKQQKIPAALINARLSNKSFNGWSLFKNSTKEILSSFNIILSQTDNDTIRFKKLGARNTITTGNIKYSASPLPVNNNDLNEISNAIGNRPVWVYASTHLGEESLACRIHQRLKNKIPDILTIIVPRHPERRDEIKNICEGFSNLKNTMRGEIKSLPRADTDIYIADSLGELGLFYSVSQVAMIGRSFSVDGGGGHNPLEAAQLKCAVITGPNIQFQQDIFNNMINAKVAKQVKTKEELSNILTSLFENQEQLKQLQNNAFEYAQSKMNIIDNVIEELAPIIKELY